METLTGMCKNTLYSLVARKQIPHVRLSRRLVLFPVDQITQWLNQNLICDVSKDLKPDHTDLSTATRTAQHTGAPKANQLQTTPSNPSQLS